MPQVRICSQAQAPAAGKGARFEVPGAPGIALFNLGGTLHALRDNCPHMDSPLHDGIVVREVVTCLWHGWQFDLRTGESLMSERIRVPVYPVTIRDGEVWIDVP